MRRAACCIVCFRAVVQSNSMCQSCQESYDRLTRRDSTSLGLIRWAAKRSRRFALERVASMVTPGVAGKTLRRRLL